jgi:hypothetical protein
MQSREISFSSGIINCLRIFIKPNCIKSNKKIFNYLLELIPANMTFVAVYNKAQYLGFLYEN